jgi:hypothetical protein
MNANDCEARLREMDRRRNAGVTLFPDDYECLRYLAGKGIERLRDEEAERRDTARTFAAIGRAPEVGA